MLRKEQNVFLRCTVHILTHHLSGSHVHPLHVYFLLFAPRLKVSDSLKLCLRPEAEWTITFRNPQRPGDSSSGKTVREKTRGRGVRGGEVEDQKNMLIWVCFGADSHLDMWIKSLYIIHPHLRHKYLTFLFPSKAIFVNV